MGKTADSVKDDASVETSGHATGKVTKTIFSSRVEKRTSQSSVTEKSSFSRDVKSVGLTDSEDSSHLSALEEGAGDSVYDVQKFERRITTTDDGSQAVTVSKDAVEHIFKSEEDKQPRKHASETVTIRRAKSALSTESGRAPSSSQLTDTPASPLEIQAGFGSTLESSNELGVKRINTQSSTTATTSVHDSEVTHRVTRSRRRSSDQEEIPSSGSDIDKGEFTVLSKPKVPWILSSQELKRDIKKKRRPLSCDADFFSGNFETTGATNSELQSEDARKVTGKDLLALKVKTEDVPQLRSSLEGGKLIRIRSLNDLDQTESESSTTTRTTTRVRQKRKTTEESVREKLAELKRESEAKKLGKTPPAHVKPVALSSALTGEESIERHSSAVDSISNEGSVIKSNSERGATHDGEKDLSKDKGKVVKRTSFNVGILKRSKSEEQAEEDFDAGSVLFGHVRELRKSCENLLFEEVDVNTNSSVRKELSNFRFILNSQAHKQPPPSDDRLDNSETESRSNTNRSLTSLTIELKNQGRNRLSFSRSLDSEIARNNVQEEAASVLAEQLVHAEVASSSSSGKSSSKHCTEEVTEEAWSETRKGTDYKYDYFVEKQRTRVNLAYPLNQSWDDDVDEGIYILKDFVEQLICEDHSRNISRVRNLSEDSEAGYFSDDNMIRKGSRPPGLGARTASLPEMTRTEFLEKHQEDVAASVAAAAKKRRNTVGGSNPDLTKRVIKVRVASRLLQSTAASKGKQKKKIDYVPIDRKPDLVFEDRPIRPPESGWVKQEFVKYPEPKTPRVQRKPEDQVIEDVEETVEWSNPRRKQSAQSGSRKTSWASNGSDRQSGSGTDLSQPEMHSPTKKIVELNSQLQPDPTEGTVTSRRNSGSQGRQATTPEKTVPKPHDRLLPKRKVWGVDVSTDDEDKEEENTEDFATKKHAFLSSTLNSDFAYNPYSIFSTPSTIFTPLSAGTQDSNTFKYIYTIDAEISYREYNKLMSIINMLQEQKRRWEEEVADAKEKFDKSGKEKMQLAHNNHILRQSLEAANKAIKEINGKVQELKQTLIPLREDNATLRGENTELKQRLELVRKEKEIFIAEVQSLKMSKSSTEELVEFKETEMEEYKILMHEKFRKLEESYRVYRDDMERKHQTMHGESNDIRHQNETQRREIDALRKDCIALMNEINELKQNNDNLKAELAKKPTTEKVTASEEFRQMTEKRNKIEENLNMELEKYREETRNLETENDQLKTDLDNMECRMKDLEAMNEISKQERLIEAQQNEVFRNHINELKKQHGDYEDLKQKKLHLTEERDRYRNQVELLQQQVEEIEYLKHERSFFETDIKRQHEEIENLKTQLLDVEKLKSEQLACAAENERLRQELDFLKKQLTILETKQIVIGSPYNDELKSELESLRNQMRDLASINQQKVTDIQNEQLKGEIQSLRNQIQDLDAFNRAQMAKYDNRTQLHQQTSEIKVSEREKILEKHFYIRDSNGNLREVKTTKDGLVAEAPQDFVEESNRLVSTSAASETLMIAEATPKSPGNDDTFGTALSTTRATKVSMKTEQPRTQILEEEILMQARAEDLSMPTEQTRRQESPLSEPELGYDSIPTKQDRIDDITKRYEEKGSLGGESPQRRIRRNSTGEVDLDATERSRDRSRKEKRSERSKTTEIHLMTENTRDHTIEHHHHHHYYTDKKEEKKDESVGPDSLLTEEERAKVIEERIRWKQQHDTMWSLRTPDINKLQRRSVEVDMDKVARFDEAMLPIRTSSLDRKELRNFSDQRQNQEGADVTKVTVKIDEDTSSSPNTTQEELRHKVIKNRTALHSDSRHHENLVKHAIVEPREPVRGSASLTSREQEIAQLKLGKADGSKMGARMKIDEVAEVRTENVFKVKSQEMRNVEGGHAEAGLDANRKKKRNKVDELKAREERRLKDRNMDDSSTSEEEPHLKDRVGRAKMKKDGLRDAPIDRSEPRQPSLEAARDEKMRSQTSTRHKHIALAQESQILQASAATWPDEDNGIPRTSSDSHSMRPKERTDTGILRTSSDSHPMRPKGRTAGPRVVGLQTRETLVRVENRHDLHAAESYQENMNTSKGISIATGTFPGKRTANTTSLRNHVDHIDLTNSSTSLDSQKQDQKMSLEIRSHSKASEKSEARTSSVSRSQNTSNQIYQEPVVPKQESTLQSSVATKAGNSGRSMNGKVEMLSQSKSTESSERRANADSRMTQNKSNQLYQEKAVTEQEAALKTSVTNAGRHEERSKATSEILETFSQDRASESSGSRASSVSRSDSKSSKLYQERSLSKQEVNVYSSSYTSGGERSKTTNGAVTLQGSEKNWIAAEENKGQYNSSTRGSDELKGDHHGYDHLSLSSSSSFRSSRRASHDQRMTHFEQYTGGQGRSNDGLQTELRQSEIDAMERARLRMLEKVNSGKVHSTNSEEKKSEENILQGHITVDGELVQRRNTGDSTRTEGQHKRNEVRLSDSSDASQEPVRSQNVEAHTRDKIPSKIHEHNFQATETRQGQVRRSSSQSVKSVSQSDYELQVTGHHTGNRQAASLERIAYQSSSLEQGTSSRLAKPPRPPKTYTRYAPQYHSVEVLPRERDPQGSKTVNRRDHKSGTSAARDDRKRFSAMSNDSLGGFSQITYTTVSEASFGPRHIDDYATQVEGLEDLRSEVDSLTRHESMNLLAKPAKESQVTREYQSTREVSQGHLISQGRK